MRRKFLLVGLVFFLYATNVLSSSNEPQVNPIEAEKFTALISTIHKLREIGKKNIILACFNQPELSAQQVKALSELSIDKILNLNENNPFLINQVKVINLDQFDAIEKEKIDAIVVYDLAWDSVYRSAWLSSAAQKIRNYLLKNSVAVVPYNPQLITGFDIKTMTFDKAVSSFVPAVYCAQSGLKGSFIEFGSFYGRFFYTSYGYLKDILQGQFISFDSFEGLSKPLNEEIKYTAGDFVEGAYFCNLDSFNTNGSLLGVDPKRIKVVPGFYQKTLVNKTIKDYGIAKRSVSVVYIDCDIYEPTLLVLRFIKDALEDGALIGFDDYFLNRASPVSGERGAILKWLEENPDIELVEYYRPNLQSNWFIFHRKKP